MRAPSSFHLRLALAFAAASLVALALAAAAVHAVLSIARARDDVATEVARALAIDRTALQFMAMTNAARLLLGTQEESLPGELARERAELRVQYRALREALAADPRLVALADQAEASNRSYEAMIDRIVARPRGEPLAPHHYRELIATRTQTAAPLRQLFVLSQENLERVRAELEREVEQTIARVIAAALLSLLFALAIGLLLGRALSKLWRAERRALLARDQFFAIASHELKTPITALSLCTQALLRSTEGEAPMTSAWLGEKLKLLERQSARLTRLSRRLLDTAQLAAGSLALSLEWTPLERLVAQSVASRRAALARAGCAVELSLAAGLVARVDRKRLDEALGELLENALTYGAGAPVDVSLTVEGTRARISVRDRGPGISPAAVERIFTPFERVVEHHTAGFGLGLWTARQLAMAMGGEIAVASEPGAGSTFSLLLPLASAQVLGELRQV